MMISTSHLLLITAGAATTLAQTLCDQFGYTSTGNGYLLNNNKWGQEGDPSGYQCLTVLSQSGDAVSWKAEYAWNGDQYNIKSYPYSGLSFKPRLVSEITSLPTEYQWSYDNTNIKADVAYDLFTSANPQHDTSSGDFELMIWTGSWGGLQPIGGTPSASATLSGRQFDIYDGYNGAMHVYSFVATDAPVQDFSADVKEFFDWLVQNKGYPEGSQYLITFQAGTEPVTGTAVLTVDRFHAQVI